MRLNNNWNVVVLLMTVLLLLVLVTGAAQSQMVPSLRTGVQEATPGGIVLGEGDELLIRVQGIDEFDGKPARIDPDGFLDVPLAGKIRATGMTVSQLEAAVAASLRRTVRDPAVSIIVSDYRSRSVSVFGAVNTPGQYALGRHTTLLQVLSKAGGLRNDAGNTIVVTRPGISGPLPLGTSTAKGSGAYWVGLVNVKSLIDGSNIQQNISLKPLDVISVPRAELVYVLGAVRKPGGFVLGEGGTVSVLQALALAEGMDKTAAPARATIIRRNGAARTEIKVDVPDILKRKSEDIALVANDILVIPSSGAKTALYKTLEAGIQAGVGIAIYHPPF